MCSSDLVAVRQREAQGPADRQHDHVGREAEAGEGRSRNSSRARAAGSHADSFAAQTRSQPMQQRRLTRGNLGLVKVRNVHRDRLGAHRDSLLRRSATETDAAPFRSKNPERRGAAPRNRCCRISQSLSGLFCHRRRRRGASTRSPRHLGGRTEEWLRAPERAADQASNFQARKLDHQAATALVPLDQPLPRGRGGGR